MINTLIIDDEPGVRSLLLGMLQNYCPQVNVMAEADSFESGIEAINKHNPQLVLLDIDLKNKSAFDMLKQLETINFKIIFITAHQQYAINAFKFSAIDYITKPVNINNLITAIQRAEKHVVKEEMRVKMEALFMNMGTTVREEKKIVVKTEKSYHVISVKDIVRCESEDNYTFFFLNDGRKIMVAKTLKEFDELLHEYGFFRAHQSHLINIDYIEHYQRNKGGLVMMKDKSSIPVAVLKKQQLIRYLEKL